MTAERGRSRRQSMSPALSFWISVLLASIACATSQQVVLSEPSTVIWASSGGGWRAMMADVGYANTFRQVGLLGAAFRPASSKFRAVSVASGGAWFALQFFFSPIFYKRVVDADITNMRSFVVDWMQSYADLQKNTPSSTLACGLVGVVPGADNIGTLCNFYDYYRANWANYTRDMFEAAGRAFGDTTGLADRLLVPENRVPAFNATELYVQTSLVANARSFATYPWQRDTVTYLGPNNRLGQVYSVPNLAQYTIQSNTTFYKYAVEETEKPFKIYVGPAPKTFCLADWKSFYLYPGKGGQFVTKGLPNDAKLTSYQYKDPFGGRPSLSAMAASSGAAGALLSGLIPSFLAQSTSLALHTASAATRAKALPQAKVVYDLNVAGETAICSRWPESCGPGDLRLIDGGAFDNPAVAMAVGQVHQSPTWPSDAKLKVILTDHETAMYSPSSFDGVHFLSYFQTTFNAGVTPGAFISPPVADQYPRRSLQIFQNFMDTSKFLSALEPIPGTNLSTALFQNLTTIENAPLGVKAGLRAEILLLFYNSTIPTVILGSDAAEANVQPLADLAVSVASNQVLRDRIVSFVNTP